MSSRLLMNLLISCGLVALLAAMPSITAAPQPDAANDGWEFGIQYGAPQSIMVTLPGDSKPQLYWYISYTVTNDTGEDRYFTPEISLFTNTGQEVKAGEGVNPAVFTQIKKVLGNDLLIDRTQMSGKLLQGEDNAKEGVAIFKDFDAQAGSFSIFFGGLSSNSQKVKLPEPIKVQKVDASGKLVEVTTDEVTLYKTLKLEYLIGGSAGNRANAKVEFLGKEWVMR